MSFPAQPKVCSSLVYFDKWRVVEFCSSCGEERRIANDEVCEECGDRLYTFKAVVRSKRVEVEVDCEVGPFWNRRPSKTKAYDYVFEFKPYEDACTHCGRTEEEIKRCEGCGAPQ